MKPVFKGILQWASTGAVLIAAVVLLTFASIQGDSGLQVGEEAPNIKALQLDKRTFELEDLRGKLVLLDFWATWCGPCRREIPYLRAAYEKYREQGLEIVSISLEEVTPLKRFAEDNDMTWVNLRDHTGQALRDYEVRYIPAPFLISPDGEILAEGSALKSRSLERTIEKFIHLVPDETLAALRSGDDSA